MTKLRICLVVSDFPPMIGGIASLNSALARALAEHEVVEQVAVIALTHAPSRTAQESPKLTVRYVSYRGFFGMAFSLIRELFLARNFDVFHSPNLFPAGFLMVVIAKYLLLKPTVLSFHGTDALALEGSAGTHWAKRFALFHASTSVALSHSTRALVAKHYGVVSDRFPIIAAALFPAEQEVQQSRDRLGYGEADVLVLTVCNLVKRKGTADLIEAIMQSPAHVKLMVVGDGPERAALATQIESLGLQNRVQLYGRVASTAPFYAIADIFTLPSYYIPEEGDVEGLGIVFLEAQQRGIVVIGTRSGGIPEALIDGETGVLVPEHNPTALARAITALAADVGMRERMGIAGKAFVAREFAPQKIASAYIEQYQNLC